MQEANLQFHTADVSSAKAADLSMKKNIVTVQSQVATGYVGNSMATLVIQLHGLDPVEIPTVILSNHVEYAEVLGEITPLSLFKELLKGIEINHILGDSDYLISGFNKEPELIAYLAAYIQKTKTKSNYRFIYDPVFGDFRAGGLYIPKEAADASVSYLLPLADIVLPNHFELEYILKTKIQSVEDFENALLKNSLMASKTIITTGTQLSTAEKDILTILLYEDGKIQEFETPHLAIEALGTGDLFTAVFTCQLNKGKSATEAIETAINFLHESLSYCIKKGYKEYCAEVLIRFGNLL